MWIEDDVINFICLFSGACQEGTPHPQDTEPEATKG